MLTSVVAALVPLSVEPIIYQEFVDLGFQIATKLLSAIAILLILRIVIKIAGRLTQRALVRVEPTLSKFLIHLVRILILALGILAMMDAVGVHVTSLVAILGATGIAVGLALQGTLSHFAAGVMLITLRAFEVGDVIEGAGVTGTVDEIGIFNSIILTADNIKVIIPNSNLFTTTIKNITAMATRRVDLEINIGDRDITPTIDLLLELTQIHPKVIIEPTPVCHVLSISQLGTVLYLRPWCRAEDYEQVRSELLQKIKETLFSSISTTAGTTTQ
jgi:small conductance mechanosensitive channel